MVVLVNGHSIRMLEGLKTTLTDLDTVAIDSVDIMEIVGGGRSELVRNLLCIAGNVDVNSADTAA